MSTRWRVLTHEIESDAKTATLITHAVVCLHNWLLMKAADVYMDDTRNREEADASSTQMLALDPNNHPGPNSSNYAKAVRDNFALWFKEPGRVEWQDTSVASNNY